QDHGDGGNEEHLAILSGRGHSAGASDLRSGAFAVAAVVVPRLAMSMSDIGAAPAGRKPKLAELVVETLRKRIGTGEYDTGSKLPTESQMTKIFGVSRTVVREAIAALAADGIVEARQGAGVFVIARGGMRAIDS